MNIHTAEDESRSLSLTADAGRDAGKTFKVNEVPPLEMANFVLRLLSALRLNDVADITDLIRASRDSDADVAAVLRVLTGCDPAAVKTLIEDALKHVQIAPDPQHPGAFRGLNVAHDIKEMATLTQILGGFARVNVSVG